MKSYPDIIADISANLRQLRGGIGPTAQGLTALAQAATKPAALDRKTKELIALSIGVATRYDGCIGLPVAGIILMHDDAVDWFL